MTRVRVRGNVGLVSGLASMGISIAVPGNVGFRPYTTVRVSN